MDEIERYARLIAKALHASVSPDDPVYVTEPKLHGFPNNFSFAPRPGDTTPLWRLYENAARAIVDDIERQKEQA